MKRSVPTVVWLLFLLLVLGVGLARLFQLRFDAGDVYPPYSSWRSDPLGTRALHDSLAEQPGLRLHRHFHAAHKLPEGKGAALLMLGMQPAGLDWMSEANAEAIQNFVRGGGRLVVAFAAIGEKWQLAGIEDREEESKAERPEEKDSPKQTEAKEDKAKEDKASEGGTKLERASEARRARDRARRLGDRRRARLAPEVGLRERWGIEYKYEELEAGEDGMPLPVTVERVANVPTPLELSWHSALGFALSATNWVELYRRGEHVVVAERRYGLGTIVVCSDAYLFSNEALRNDRQPRFLAWALGGATAVWFDEAHLGTREEPGVANLVRAYGLHGLVLGLLWLAALYVWRQSVPLVPAAAADQAGRGGEIEVGRGFGSGMVNVLRRAVAPAELPAACLEAWQRSCVRERARFLAHAEAMRQVLHEYEQEEKRGRDPVRAVRRMAAELDRRSKLKPTEARASVGPVGRASGERSAG